jgi:dynein regulatry complex protein 1
LQEEAVRSGKQNAAVEMRWALVARAEHAIRPQKSACAEIISGKDGLIADAQTQLKAEAE